MKQKIINLDHLVERGVAVVGSKVKTAIVQSEWYVNVFEPEAVMEALSAQGVKADIFTFIQRPPDNVPRYPYYYEWDEMACISVGTFQAWWESQIPKSTRKHIRRSQKLGVVTRIVPFDEALLRGIADIYNESPVRDGTPFLHYGKSMEDLKASHETFLDRSDFIGAFLGDELIGFIKLTYSGETGRTMQIISKIKHRDKWPTNALIAKAVERCAEKGTRYLVYGQLRYGKLGNPGLRSFKIENGFCPLNVPRYYVPLTAKGRFVLALGLHKGLAQLLPRRAVPLLRAVRKHLTFVKALVLTKVYGGSSSLDAPVV